MPSPLRRMAVRYSTPQFLTRSTARPFCNGTGTNGKLVRYLNLPTKRFMCNVRPSMKIHATVPGVHNGLGYLQVMIIVS